MSNIRMSLSIFALILLVIVPSYIFAVTFRMMKVPLRISLADYKAPVQIFLLGILLPAIPYFLAYAISNLTTALTFYTPWKVVIGVITSESINWHERWTYWTILFFIYFVFCFLEALLISLLARSWSGLIILFDRLQILDEQEFLAQRAKLVAIEIDITVVGLQFVYSGTIEKTHTSSLLNSGCVQLSKVLKIPISEANKDIGSYLLEVVNKPETDSREWLKTMVFPKDKINTLNLRVQKIRDFEIQLL